MAVQPAALCSLPHWPPHSAPSCHARRLLVYLLLTVMLAGSMYGVVTIGRPGNAARSDDFLLGGGGALLDGGAGAAALPQRRHHGQKQQQRGRHAHQQGRQRAHAAGWDVRVHGEASGRRAAAEQPGGGALAGASRSSLEQQRLQQQRDRERQALEQHSSGAQAAGDLEAWDSIDDAEETAEAEAARQQAALEARHLSDLQQQQQLEAAAAAAAAAAAGQQQQQQQGGDEELPALHPDPAVAAAVAAHIAAQQALPRRTGPSLYAANLTGGEAGLAAQQGGLCQVSVPAGGAWGTLAPCPAVRAGARDGILVPHTPAAPCGFAPLPPSVLRHPSACPQAAAVLTLNP
jgi:hypothetical protein